jgi:hypothetical protein
MDISIPEYYVNMARLWPYGILAGQHEIVVDYSYVILS